LAGSVIPAGVAHIERTVSPELNATNGFLDKIKSRIPGYSDDLPPRRNIFGEVIVLSGGLGPDIMSPIYISTDKHDAVADEIVEQKTIIRMPVKTVRGVELDLHQYDKYVTLYAGEDNPLVEMPLKMALRDLFASSMYKNGTTGTDGSKSVMIQSIFNGYKQAAQAQLIAEDPSLEVKMILNKQEKARALGGNI